MANKDHSSWSGVWGACPRAHEQKELPLAPQISPNSGCSFDKSGHGIYGLSHARYLRSARYLDSTATNVICYGSQMASTLYSRTLETATIHIVRSLGIHYSFMQSNSPQLVGAASSFTDRGRTTPTEQG